MFKQKRVTPIELAEKLDLIYDIPEVTTYRAPFHTDGGEPEGFMGLEPYWEIVDADEQPVAHVFCRDIAVAVVRMLNRRNQVEMHNAPELVVTVLRAER